MLPAPLLAAASVLPFLGLALFRKKKKEDEEEATAPAKAPPAQPAKPAPAQPAKAAPSQPAKAAPSSKPLVLKAFVLNRKAELVGELAAEGESVGVGYDGVLKLLEGKGLTKVKRLESSPYLVHILQDPEQDYFMVAFTRSRDDRAVLEEARALLMDTLRDLR